MYFTPHFLLLDSDMEFVKIDVIYLYNQTANILLSYVVRRIWLQTHMNCSTLLEGEQELQLEQASFLMTKRL